MTVGAEAARLCRRGIGACQRRDARGVQRVVLELIGALDFGYEDAALGLFQLYQQCMAEARAGRFDLPHAVFSKLGRAWAMPGDVWPDDDDD